MGGNVGKWDGARDWKEDIDYSTYDDNMPEEEYWKWQREILNESFRILKPSGSFFYNHKVRRYERKAYHPIVELIDHKLTFYQQIVWNRKGSVNNHKSYLSTTTELIFWFIKDKPKVNKKQAPFTSEVWTISPAFGNKHPAPFPTQLVDGCVLLTTDKNDTVLDPFMGSGTTGVACAQLGRKFIGIEIDKDYFEIAKKRIELAYSQTVMF